MKVHFGAYWTPGEAREHGLPRGTLILRAEERYWPSLRKLTEKGMEKIMASAEMNLEVFVDLDLPLKKRSLEANALMWSLYEVEANEQNANRKEPGGVTAEQLYGADMENEKVVPMVDVVIDKDLLDQLEKVGMKWIRAEPMAGSAKLLRVKIAKTSSKWDTLEMSRHIDMLFNRLARAGVTNPDEIGEYWLRWRKHLADKKIIYAEHELSQEEYREAHPICEGCGKFIGEGAVGHLHHIRSRGAADEKLADHSDDWMMLCPDCHDIWTAVGGGVVAFVEKYPHTRWRIERILGEVKADGHNV